MSAFSITPVLAGLSAAVEVTPSLHRAAVEFEAMLLKDLMKPLGQSSVEGEAMEGSGSDAGPLQGFAIDAVASALSRSGALGFAKQIEQTLAHAAREQS